MSFLFVLDFEFVCFLGTKEASYEFYTRIMRAIRKLQFLRIHLFIGVMRRWRTVANPLISSLWTIVDYTEIVPIVILFNNLRFLTKYC